jgi:YD repeat-containing protein
MILSFVAVVIAFATLTASAEERYEYDVLGRLTRVRYDNNSTITYAYDKNGSLVSTSVGLVSVDERDAASIPGAVTLEQNHPNPFQSVTTVRFTLHEAQSIRLALQDLLGREVAVLAGGPMAAGAHDVAFDARALVPGTYLLRLTAGGRVLSRTMQVLR